MNPLFPFDVSSRPIIQIISCFYIMATVHPFRALRPLPAFAQQVACVPYDVINTAEARALSEGNAHSFLHVIRPEIDFPEGTDEHDDRVYDKGAQNLAAYRDSEVSVQEESPSLYVYRLIMEGRAQTGVYACVSVDEYNNNIILKHEKTRPDKEADRTRHIVTQQAHAEPVMLTFRDHEGVQVLINKAMEGASLYDFTAPDGVQHTIWKVEDTQGMVDAFGDVPALYIADGHHRCKAASLAAKEAGGSEEKMFFPAVLFPMNEMAILAYNRIVYSLPDGFMDRLSATFEVASVEKPVPQEAGTICLYTQGSWYSMKLPETQRGSVADTLDVARLSEHILEPLLGIMDVRTDKNIYFVGGIRGTSELERLADSGKVDLAISMYPTQIEELLAVSDAGLLMPPKSTWFEPKLRSGLLVHLF